MTEIAHGDDARVVTDEMRTATISVAVSCMDARHQLDKVMDKYFPAPGTPPVLYVWMNRR
jgi:hypothetical protein